MSVQTRDGSISGWMDLWVGGGMMMDEWMDVRVDGGIVH